MQCIHRFIRQENSFFFRINIHIAGMKFCSNRAYSLGFYRTLRKQPRQDNLVSCPCMHTYQGNKIPYSYKACSRGFLHILQRKPSKGNMRCCPYNTCLCYKTPCNWSTCSWNWLCILQGMPCKDSLPGLRLCNLRPPYRLHLVNDSKTFVTM